MSVFRQKVHLTLKKVCYKVFCVNIVSDKAVGLRRYDSRLRGLRFYIFFNMAAHLNHTTTSCYHAIVGLTNLTPVIQTQTFDQYKSCNSVLRQWHCSVKYSVNNNKSRDQFRFLIGGVSILVFRFWRNIDTTSGNTALLKNYHSHDHCLLSKSKHDTCAETPLHESTQNDKSRVEKYFASHIWM